MPRRLSFVQLRLTQQPLIFIALAFIGGLLFAAHVAAAPRVWLAALGGVWTLSALVWRWQAGRAGLTLGLLGGCVCAGGALWALTETPLPAELEGKGGLARVAHLLTRGALRPDEPCEVWGTLDALPELAPDRLYLNLAVERVATLGKAFPARGFVQLVVPLREADARRDYDALHLDYGTRVRVWCFLRQGGGFRNPGAPDFAELLEQRGFDASGWIKSPLLIEVLGAAPRNRVLHQLYRWRAQALATLLHSYEQPAAGMLAAALWGNRYFLPRAAAETFRDGGTFHLLVISGLHVVLIASVLLWLTQPWRRERWLRFGFVLATLWLYGLMVGAQASIMRAVVMVTLALFGQVLFRHAPGANTLAAAALVLLSWQPRDLFNAGFQLSFLTVAVIVLLVVPVHERLRQVGLWQPTALTPYPPRVLAAGRWLAEALCWDERRFQHEQATARIRFQLDKARTARWLNRWRLQAPLRWLALTLFTTICVQVALLPLMLVYFHRFSLVSPLTNVIEAIGVFLLMLAGALHLALAGVSATAAAWLVPLVNGLGAWTVKAGQWPLAWPRASVRMPDWGAGAAWLYGGFFVLIVALVLLVNEWHPLRKGDEPHARQRRWLGRLSAALSLGLILVLSVLLVVHPFPPQFTPGRFSLTLLDVGQGDALFLSFPQGQTLLLDSGGRLGYASASEDLVGDEDLFIEDRLGVGEAAVLPFLWQLGLKRLDYIAATHGDSDHTEAFGEITRALPVSEAWAGSWPPPEAAPDLFTQAVRRAGIPLRVLQRGDQFTVDGVQIDVLAPFDSAGAHNASDNNSSLVLRLRFGQRTFLLTGDIEKQTEARLLEAGENLRADVLKVAHHGSRTSSTAAFLAQVQPAHALISAGHPSPFGHPHPEVVERLRATGARLWQTSQCGALTVSTDGVDLQITSVACP